MTDDMTDRQVRAADPYDPDSVRDLDGADLALLEQIVELSPGTERSVRWRRPLTIGLVAAAVLAIAVAVPALIRDPDSEPARDGQTVQAGGGTDKIVYLAAAVEVAENNPRLLIDEPGWKATTVYGFAKDSGTINFEKGDREVEMNWYAADAYESYFDDRTEVSEREPITIDGQRGSRVTYGPGDVAAMLEPEGSTFVEIRTSGFADSDAALALFGRIKHVDVGTWLAALPPEIVLPGRIDEIADEILADVPLPPDFDRDQLAHLGVNDRYQFGAEVISLVECGWLAEWKRADESGDAGAQERAVTALRSARGWDVLAEMDQTGDYSDGPWQIAASIKLGDDPVTYQEMEGCAP